MQCVFLESLQHLDEAECSLDIKEEPVDPLAGTFFPPHLMSCSNSEHKNKKIKQFFLSICACGICSTSKNAPSL